MTGDQLVLLEGPDGGGKTTLGRALEALDGYVYQHNGPPPVSERSVFWWQLRGLCPAVGRAEPLPPGDASPARWVVDRSWPSEQVYHQFAGRPDAFDPLVHRMFERYLLGVNGAVVLCLPSFNRAASAWQARAAVGGELVGDLAQFSTIYEHYVTWQATTSVPVLRYDYEHHSMAALRAALAQLQSARHRNPAPHHLSGNAGDARLLVVGEQYNTSAAPPGGPFVPFAGEGRNGKFLSFELTHAGLTERDLAWVNARQPNGDLTPHQVLSSFVRERDEVAVLTLGTTARQWAEAAVVQGGCGSRVTLFSITHPAYHARFQHGKPWGLRDLAPALWHFRCGTVQEVAL